MFITLLQDRCTTQHKAANDQRTGSTWRASAETGVMGMGCRHDNLLALISINTGERYNHFSHSQYTSFYA